MERKRDSETEREREIECVCEREQGYQAERAHRLAPLLLQLLQDPSREPPQAVHHLTVDWQSVG